MSYMNYTLLCDFYELTMANGYFELGKKDEISYFDVFFRKVPDGGGFGQSYARPFYPLFRHND